LTHLHPPTPCAVIPRLFFRLRVHRLRPYRDMTMTFWTVARRLSTLSPTKKTPLWPKVALRSAFFRGKPSLLSLDLFTVASFFFALLSFCTFEIFFVSFAAGFPRFVSGHSWLRSWGKRPFLHCLRSGGLRNCDGDSPFDPLHHRLNLLVFMWTLWELAVFFPLHFWLLDRPRCSPIQDRL